jgi:hypothetical protein
LLDLELVVVGTVGDLGEGVAGTQAEAASSDIGDVEGVGVGEGIVE